MRVVAVFVVFAMASLAGCVEPTPTVQQVPTDSVPTNVLKDGRDLRTQLQATDVIEGAQWKVGDWFGHHVFFTGGPEEGMHIQTIVVDDKGDSWLLATDDKEMAKIESVFDIPIIGPLKKKDLSGTGFGAPWEPYDFPLTHGKTWTGEIQAGDVVFGGEETVQVNYEVVFNPAITTPDGDRPGFDIFGRTSDDKLLLAYDYVPDIQWYAHFYAYDVSTEDPEDFDFHVMSMGHGSGWTGTYYIDESKVLVEAFHGIAVDPEMPANSFVDPNPYIPFTVDDAANYVYGFAFSAAYMGLQETLVLDPDNGRYEFMAHSVDPMSFSEVSGEINVAAKPGEWKVLGVGAGGAAIWGVFVWQVTEVAKTL